MSTIPEKSAGELGPVGIVIGGPSRTPVAFSEPNPPQPPYAEDATSPFPNAKWKTELCGCNQDEEICWWGCWCCWLVHARTAQTFEVGTSRAQILYFWSWISVSCALILFANAAIGLICLIMGAIFLATVRASLRGAIRGKQGIPGVYADDLMKHCCCSCCAVCQEAREAKVSVKKVLDFCSGEELILQDEAHEVAIGHGQQSATDQAIPEGGTFWSHLKQISKTSRIILSLSICMACLTFYLIGVSSKPENIGVLILTFVQPLLIFYIFYWRTRRQYASLDYVIKCFAVGFWFTPIQTIIIESIAQGVVVFLLSPFFADMKALSVLFALSGVGAGDDGGVSENSGSFGSNNGSDSLSSGSGEQFGANSMIRGLMRAMSRNSISRPLQMFVDRLPSTTMSWATTYSSLVPLAGVQKFSVVSYALNLMPFGDKIYAAPSAGDDYIGLPEFDNIDVVQALLKKYMPVIVIFLLLQAFVVAAGCEETMKHFVVRCCPFPSPLKNPQSVMVYLLAGATGFATLENIEYVFRTTMSPVPGTSVVVGELLVLLVRVCLPVHELCSVMQATNLSKVMMGIKQMSLFGIMLPGIIFHGSFDFLLFLMGLIEIVTNQMNMGMEILSLGLASIITIIGAVYACWRYKRVEKDFIEGWQAFPEGGEEGEGVNDGDDIVEVPF